jgi:hypothetical protein
MKTVIRMKSFDFTALEFIMGPMKKTLLLIAPFLLLACTPDESRFKSDVPVSRPSLEERIQQAEETVAELSTQDGAETVDKKPLPPTINLDVPFYPQAPDADWNLPWQEACEEASQTLAYYYAVNQELSKEEFKERILGLVDWQVERFGSYIHTTIDQMAEVFRDYFGFENFRVVENPTIEDMKRELAKGNIIVAPFAGKMLGNPFYSGEGPYYHVMVIKGYDQKNFIVNDVGTRRGEDFLYSYETIMKSMHDYLPWGIETGPRKVIVVEEVY